MSRISIDGVAGESGVRGSVVDALFTDALTELLGTNKVCFR